MNKIIFHLFFLAIFTPTVFAQNSKEDMIDWNAGTRLSWSDYKASPDPNSDAAASTTTLLGIEYSMRDNKFSYTITCKFSRLRSWGLHKTVYILAHEQGHFDIAEIFARKLNKRMSEYRFNKNTYEKELSKIYQETMKQKEDMQDQYDKETNHSIKKDKQVEWLKKIDSMLEDLKEYAGY